MYPSVFLFSRWFRLESLRDVFYDGTRSKRASAWKSAAGRFEGAENEICRVDGIFAGCNSSERGITRSVDRGYR